MNAAILIIGNEILSGRVQDRNIQFIAKRLGDIGIKLEEVRIVQDIKKDIIEAVNLLRKKYKYLFTTGGIGPTHDDITTESVAEAFGKKLIVDQKAFGMIESFYKSINQEMNEFRKKMAIIPEGSEIIKNDITKAPGFKIDNVFVLAGIPEITFNMFGYVEEYLEKSSPIISKNIKVIIGESVIAKEMTELQNKYPELDIGSYPYKKDEIHATDVVIKGKDINKIDISLEEFRNILEKRKIKYE